MKANVETLRHAGNQEERARAARDACADRELQIQLNLEVGSKFSKNNKVEHRVVEEGGRMVFYRFCTGEVPKKYALNDAENGAGIRFTLIRQGLMSVA